MAVPYGLETLRLLLRLGLLLPVPVPVAVPVPVPVAVPYGLETLRLLLRLALGLGLLLPVPVAIPVPVAVPYGLQTLRLLLRLALGLGALGIDVDGLEVDGLEDLGFHCLGLEVRGLEIRGPLLSSCHRVADVTCADLDIGERDTEHWSAYPTQQVASSLGPIEGGREALAYDEHHVDGGGQRFGVVEGQKRGRFHEDDVGQVARCPEDPRGTEHQLTAVRDELTERDRRDVLDGGGPQTCGEVGRGDFPGRTAPTDRERVQPDIEGAHHEDTEARLGVRRCQIGHDDGTARLGAR